MGSGSWDTRSFVSYSTSKGYGTDSRGSNVSCRLNSGNHVLMQQLVICIENLQMTTIK